MQNLVDPAMKWNSYCSNNPGFCSGNPDYCSRNPYFCVGNTDFRVGNNKLPQVFCVSIPKFCVYQAARKVGFLTQRKLSAINNDMIKNQKEKTAAIKGREQWILRRCLSSFRWRVRIRTDLVRLPSCCFLLHTRPYSLY